MCTTRRLLCLNDDEHASHLYGRSVILCSAENIPRRCHLNFRSGPSVLTVGQNGESPKADSQLLTAPVGVGVYHTHVPPQTRHMSEPLPALPALVALHTGMTTHVGVEVTRLCESGIARFARVGSLTGVHSHVHS